MFTGKNKSERIKMVRAMEFIARQINDEEVLYRWLLCGVADGDIYYNGTTLDEDLEFYAEDDVFAELMETFLRVMSLARRSGGLYCDGILSGEVE